MGELSRRRLLKAGAFLAASASPAIRATAAAALTVTGPAPVALTRSTFEPFVGDAFDLGSGENHRSVVLVDVSGIKGGPAGQREEGRFSLLFRDSSAGTEAGSGVPAAI